MHSLSLFRKELPRYFQLSNSSSKIDNILHEVQEYRCHGNLDKARSLLAQSVKEHPFNEVIH